MLDLNPKERGTVRELAVVLSSQGDWLGASNEALKLLGDEGPKTKYRRSVWPEPSCSDIAGI